MAVTMQPVVDIMRTPNEMRVSVFITSGSLRDVAVILSCAVVVGCGSSEREGSLIAMGASHCVSPVETDAATNAISNWLTDSGFAVSQPQETGVKIAGEDSHSWSGMRSDGQTSSWYETKTSAGPMFIKVDRVVDGDRTSFHYALSWMVNGSKEDVAVGRSESERLRREFVEFREALDQEIEEVRANERSGENGQMDETK